MNEEINYSGINDISHDRYRVRIADFCICLVSFLCSIVFLIANSKSYCNSIVLLPALFGVCYLVFAAPIIRRQRSKTMIIVSVCEFLRCVVLSVFTAFSDYNGFSLYSTNDSGLIFHAVMLMAWEMIVIFVFLHFYIRNHAIETHEIREISLADNRYAIYFIILAGILIYIASPQIRRYISFLAISSASEKVRDIEAGGTSSVFTGLMTFVHNAFLCIFILVLDTNAKKYQANQRRRYAWIATFMGLITISVIFGESRATIIYTLYAVISCLRLKFEKHRNGVLIAVGLTALAVIVGMTVYRLFAVYKYSSYSAAIENGGYMGQNYDARFMESYLLGPQSIAAGIEFKNQYAGNFSVLRLIFDIFRPFMGFNLILQRFSVTPSITLYNSWLTGVAGRSNGNFLQITAQGYCYFGFLFAPLFTCVFLWISVKIENWMKKETNLFIYFFLCYVFIRTSTCVLGGTMSGYITNLSMTFLMCGFFVLLQKLFSSFVRRKRI